MLSDVFVRTKPLICEISICDVANMIDIIHNLDINECGTSFSFI